MSINERILAQCIRFAIGGALYCLLLWFPAWMNEWNVPTWGYFITFVLGGDLSNKEVKERR